MEPRSGTRGAGWAGLLAVVLLLVGTLAACGGGGDDAAEGTTTTAAAGDGTTDTTAAPSGDGATDTTTAPAGGGEPDDEVVQGGGSGAAGGGDGGGTTETTAEPKSLDASLDATCVARGGQQGFTATIDPGGTVIYDTTYSDGASSSWKPGADQRGDNGFAEADGSGNVREQWVVPPDAPLGDAQVAMAAPGYDFARLPFEVVALPTECPV